MPDSPSRSLHTVLHETFGFDDFRPGQQEVIVGVVEGRSTLAVFPTGQGKSLCYQLPALVLPGLTLVVSPLVALMKDQVDFLLTKKIAAARLDSSLAPSELTAVREQMRSGRLKLLFIAPERFASERFLAMATSLAISLLVIDEAHCISEWGHNFRPEYLKLPGHAKTLGTPPVLALTATATPAVAEDIRRAFAIAHEDVIRQSFHRPNLEILFAPSADPTTQLLNEIRRLPAGPAIVYVTLQATAERVARALADHDLPARHYHAGMKDEERSAVQDWFMTSTTGIVVATIAFGMGIDKAGIRAVYHYNLPKSLENYAQEIGRAGRDGAPSRCVVLGNGEDIATLENFVYGDTPETWSIRQITQDIMAGEPEFSISLYQASRQYDMRPLVIKTLLAYLELEHCIASTGPFYGSYRFRPLKNTGDIFARFDAERAAFLRDVFSCATKAKTWFDIELADAMEKTGASRQRIVAALGYLEEQGDLELQITDARLGFRRLRNMEEREKTKEGLVARLATRFKKREENDISRVAQVLELINHQGCQTDFLLAHFGDTTTNGCGHCGHCLFPNRPAPRINAPEDAPIGTKTLAAVAALASEHQEALGTPRQRARFLCGLTSPRTTQQKLTRHPLFASLAGQPFIAVLKAMMEIP